MDVRNCKNCGRLFNVLSSERLCPACRQEVEDKFQEVKRYIEEHRNATVNEVSIENDVTVKQIKQWIREERLSFSEGSMEGVECEKCGKLIRMGRFCDECKKNVTNTLMSAMDQPKVKPVEPTRSGRDKDRMRFL